jgi:hypothetical protein
MEQKIGFPHFLNNVNEVDEMYSLFQVTDSNYYATKFQFCHQQQIEMLQRFGTQVDRNK